MNPTKEQVEAACKLNGCRFMNDANGCPQFRCRRLAEFLAARDAERDREWEEKVDFWKRLASAGAAIMPCVVMHMIHSGSMKANKRGFFEYDRLRDHSPTYKIYSNRKKSATGWINKVRAALAKLDKPEPK